MAKVTDPQSISAIDAPRSIDAAAAADMPPRAGATLRGAEAADAGAMMVTRSVQRSRTSRASWSPWPAEASSMASLRVAGVCMVNDDS